MKKNKNAEQKAMNNNFFYVFDKKNLLKIFKIARQSLFSNVFKILEMLEIQNSELSLTLCSDRQIHKLNLKYRNKDYPTDVLSFSMSEINEETERNYLGDIVISADTVMRNASEFNERPEIEFYRILIHGIQHLAGFTHETEKKYKMMMDKNKRILNCVEIQPIKPGLTNKCKARLVAAQKF